MEGNGTGVNRFVPLDLRRRPHGDHLPIIQNQDPVAQTHDDLHIVLHQDHRDPIFMNPLDRPHIVFEPSFGFLYGPDERTDNRSFTETAFIPGRRADMVMASFAGLKTRKLLTL